MEQNVSDRQKVPIKWLKDYKGLQHEESLWKFNL